MPLAGRPDPGATWTFNPNTDEFTVGHVWEKNGGSASTAKNIADSIADSVNGILETIGGEVVDGEHLFGNRTRLNGAVDIKNGELRYRTWNRQGGHIEKISIKDGKTFVEYGIFRMLENMEIAGGNVYIKRALYRTLEQVWNKGANKVTEEDALQILMGNITVAADYASYVEDSFLLNALMSVQPDSAFTAGWLITLVRADEIGLNLRHWSDHLGGWNYLLKDTDFAAGFNGFAGRDWRRANAADVELDFIGNERVIRITKANGQTDIVNDYVLGGDKTVIDFTTQAALNAELTDAVAAVIYGTDGDDTITGGNLGNDIFGGRGMMSCRVAPTRIGSLGKPVMMCCMPLAVTTTFSMAERAMTHCMAPMRRSTMIGPIAALIGCAAVMAMTVSMPVAVQTF